jgi:hypothetical protein
MANTNIHHKVKVSSKVQDGKMPSLLLLLLLLVLVLVLVLVLLQDLHDDVFWGAWVYDETMINSIIDR